MQDILNFPHDIRLALVRNHHVAANDEKKKKEHVLGVIPPES